MSGYRAPWFSASVVDSARAAEHTHFAAERVGIHCKHGSRYPMANCISNT